MSTKTVNKLKAERVQEELAAQDRLKAERLRDAVKFKIGRRNERLVQFNIAPLRRRSRKPVVVEKEMPPVVTPDVKK